MFTEPTTKPQRTPNKTGKTAMVPIKKLANNKIYGNDEKGWEKKIKKKIMIIIISIDRTTARYRGDFGKRISVLWFSFFLFSVQCLKYNNNTHDRRTPEVRSATDEQRHSVG